MIMLNSCRESPDLIVIEKEHKVILEGEEEVLRSSHGPCYMIIVLDLLTGRARVLGHQPEGKFMLLEKLYRTWESAEADAARIREEVQKSMPPEWIPKNRQLRSWSQPYARWCRDHDYEAKSPLALGGYLYYLNQRMPQAG